MNISKSTHFILIAEAPCCDQSLLHTRVEISSSESDRAVKRLKTI